MARSSSPEAALAARLAGAGFVAPEEEAAELLAAAAGDPSRLEALAARRLTGEPLAWITGTTTFCGVTVRVDRGVYVPRWTTEAVARRAIARLPDRGVAVDVCTGCGAVAAALRAARRDARVLATDLDPRAVACARANGVDARAGDLLAPLPAAVGAAVVVAVVPYVPTAELRLLHRDALAFEPRLAYDGGPDGLALLRRVVAEAPRVLRRGGALVLELGGDQARALRPALREGGFAEVEAITDEDGDVRGVEATLASPGR